MIINIFLKYEVEQDLSFGMVHEYLGRNFLPGVVLVTNTGWHSLGHKCSYKAFICHLLSSIFIKIAHSLKTVYFYFKKTLLFFLFKINSG